jgi:hypothetical protein
MEDRMKKFMALYMAPVAEFEKVMKDFTPQDQQKAMDDWMKWMNANQKAIVDGGAPLGKTMRVDGKGVAAVRNEVGGYTIVQASSHDDAAKIFGKSHPHFTMPGAWIEIIEIMPMPTP